MNSNKKDIPSNDEISSLIKNINVHPDNLHIDYTPAVHKLCEYGLDAIKAVLHLLNSTDCFERYRAQRVVEGVIQRRFGWKAGQGYPKDADGEEQFLALWLANGDYTAEASEKIRLEAIKKWESWLLKNLKDGKK